MRSAFRPSDDATVLQFLIPSNAFMSVELGHLSTILRDIKSHAHLSQDTISFLAEQADALSKSIADGIKGHAIFSHPLFDRVYAYEVDGYGGRLFMDDANLPSLLSLPLLGFVEKKDPVYQATRKMVLSHLGNPYFLEGRQFKGIGGPHIGVKHAWPMSLLVQIMTSDDDEEITDLLDLLKASTGGLGLMHESGIYSLSDKSDCSTCEESCGLYQAVVCMGEWFIWRDDFGFDGTETGIDIRERV